MDNLKSYNNFINESKKDRYEYDYDGASSRIKEIRRRIEAETPEEKIYQMVYDEGGAAMRLLKGVAAGLNRIGQGISDLFDTGTASSMDYDKLDKNKESVLSKWGTNIKASGKNKEKDYEEFYRNAILKGRTTFGKDFDLKNPSGKEQELYRDYVYDATNYFDVK